MKRTRRAMRIALLCASAAFGCSACGEEPYFDTQAVAASKARRPETAGKTPFGQNAADYVLTFAEEFDDLDHVRWKDHIWYERSHPMRNFTAEGGVLKI